MGKVYLIKCYEETELLYKIGFTRNFASTRMKSFNTGNPNDLEIVEEFYTNYDTKMEMAIQNRFKSKKVKGEWYRLEIEDVKNFIELCKKIEGNFELLEREGNHFFKKLLSKK